MVKDRKREEIDDATGEVGRRRETVTEEKRRVE